MSTEILLRPVQRSQLSEQAIERIKNYITDNNLQAGVKLPGERDLAKSLGVSRNVAREALRALQATGILEIQPGNGIFVAEFGFEALANHFSFVVGYQQHQMEHLIEARLIFENGILELAARRLTPQDIKLLEKAAYHIASARNSAEDLTAELEFHEHLVRITGNPVLMEFAPFFNRFFHDGRKAMGDFFGTPEVQKMIAQEHIELTQALKQKDVPLAKSILEKSIRRWCGEQK